MTNKEKKLAALINWILEVCKHYFITSCISKCLLNYYELPNRAQMLLHMEQKNPVLPMFRSRNHPHLTQEQEHIVTSLFTSKLLNRVVQLQRDNGGNTLRLLLEVDHFLSSIKAKQYFVFRSRILALQVYNRSLSLFSYSVLTFFCLRKPH